VGSSATTNRADAQPSAALPSQSRHLCLLGRVPNALRFSCSPHRAVRNSGIGLGVTLHACFMGASWSAWFLSRPCFGSLSLLADLDTRHSQRTYIRHVSVVSGTLCHARREHNRPRFRAHFRSWRNIEEHGHDIEEQVSCCSKLLKECTVSLKLVCFLSGDSSSTCPPVASCLVQTRRVYFDT